MQTIQRSEYYTDREHYVVVTRTAVLKDARLAWIADHLRHSAEDVVSTSNPPTIHDRRIADSGVPSRARMMRFCPKCDRWRTVPHGQTNCEACSSAFEATQDAMSKLPEGTTFLMGC